MPAEPASLVRWTTAFLDFADADANAGFAFWEQLTGSTLSPRRGDRGQFATLTPSDGDAYLRVQDVGSSSSRCHLDLHVDDVLGAADRARRLGASIGNAKPTLVILESPAGLVFCIVQHRGESHRPSVLRWVDGTRSLVDQICLDVPSDAFDFECSFWSALTGWGTRSDADAGFVRLDASADQPLQIVLQRCGATSGRRSAGTYPAWACDDVEAEVNRHCELGATVMRRAAKQVTLADPTGREYRVTERPVR